MSEEPGRTRRRPSREYHQTPGQRHPLEDPEDPEDQPRRKVFKKSSPSEEDYPRGDDEPSTSRGRGSRSRHDKDKDSIRDSTSKRRDVSQGGGDTRSVSRCRDRREQYEIVRTKPSDVDSKRGTSGKEIRLYTNYFRLMTAPKWNIYQYHVTFAPEIESKRLRGGLLYGARPRLGGYLYDGARIFTITKLPDDVTIFQVTSRQDEKYVITLRYVGVIAMDQWESLQVLNLIIRRAMEGLKLQLIQRNYYDPHAKIEMRDYRMQLWPGYQTTLRQHERDILLCCEIIHKIMRQETLLDIFHQCVKASRDYEEEYKRQILGRIVLTDYNNRTYCITDVDFTKTPQSTFTMKDGEVSFIDYFRKKYGIHIRDTKQPLLITKAKEYMIRAGQSGLIMLVPELCRPTGLTDTMRTDMRLMRSMADHTRLTPRGRIDRLRTFNRRLQQTADSMAILKDWNMELAKELVEVKGRVLDPQRIVFKDHHKESAGENADWTRLFRDRGLFTTPLRGVDRWSLIAPHRLLRESRAFIENLIRASNSMQMLIRRPTEVLIQDDRINSYLQAIEDSAARDPQLILCVVPNNNSDRYASIKKKCCAERPVPTQVITHRSVSNMRGLMSVATKVAIQINCKLGYTPWMIDLPLSGLMTIGYDTAKSMKDKKKAYCALVASMDMKTNATFYSTVAECNSQDTLATNLWPMMIKALRQYHREHDKLPNRILFYRDGVSEGSIPQLYNYEVKEIVDKLDVEYKRCKMEKPPMFAYVAVAKSINTRIFQADRNPPPGTVIDDIITLPERYDFFLVSQSVRQGTVSPTSYNVLYSTIRLTPDQMQLLTYKMTHLYYNWSGTTRVPAVCQYAKKLATLVGTCIFQTPISTLEKKLYYL